MKLDDQHSGMGIRCFEFLFSELDEGTQRESLQADPEETMALPEFIIPEHNLLKRLLEQAYNDLDSADFTVHRVTRTWFFCNDREPFSLLWVLDHLKLDDNLERIRTEARNVILHYRDAHPKKEEKQQKKGLKRRTGARPLSLLYGFKKSQNAAVLRRYRRRLGCSV